MRRSASPPPGPRAGAATPRSAVLAFASLTLAAAALTATPAEAQIVVGVVGAEDSAAVVGAAVTLLDVADTAVSRVTTDATGAFRLFAPAPGRYRIEVEAIGHRTRRTDAFDVAAEQVLRIRILLRVEPVPLAALTVVAREPHPLGPLLRGMRERVAWNRKLGRGTILDRKEIEKRGAMGVGQLLEGRVPRVMLRSGPYGHGLLYLRRGPATCALTIYVDGVSMGSGIDVNQFVPVSSLETVEVYRGIDADPEYPSGCGSVLLWTRRGDAAIDDPEPASPINRRTLGVVGILGLMSLLFYLR